MAVGSLTPAEVATYVATQLSESFPNPSDRDGTYRGKCPDPNHPGDRNGDSCTLSATGLYQCHSHGCKGNIFSLHHKLSGLADKRESAREVYEILGRSPRKWRCCENADSPVVSIVKYGYEDESGATRRFNVRRNHANGSKCFGQGIPDSNARDGISYKIAKGTPNLLYKLPALLAAIKEGE